MAGGDLSSAAKLYLNIIEALLYVAGVFAFKHSLVSQIFLHLLLAEELPCHENCMHSIHNKAEATTACMLKR